METSANKPLRTTDGPESSFPKGIWWLLGVAVLLAGTSGITYIISVFALTESQTAHLLAYHFDVGRENNIPTWYSSVLWLGLGALGILGAAMTELRVSWIFFAAVCVGASVDEYAQLHELFDVLGNRMQEALGTSLWFTWVLPGMIMAAVMVLPLFFLVRRMPKASRAGLLAAGAVFLSGALLMESVSGRVLAHFNDFVTWHYILATLVEEFLELTGVCLAIGAVSSLYRWRLLPRGLHVEFKGWHGERTPVGATSVPSSD